MSGHRALAKLREAKLRLQRRVAFTYEHAARDCRSCPAPAPCCTDVHFVNVHITWLEARAIEEKLAELPEETRQAVRLRARAAVETYQLSDEGDTYARSYSCPLYVAGTGCLVHQGGAKPAPCIHHACYDDPRDGPPDSLQLALEAEIEALNREATLELNPPAAALNAEHEPCRWRPLPLWLADSAQLDAQDLPGLGQSRPQAAPRVEEELTDRPLPQVERAELGDLILEPHHRR